MPQTATRNAFSSLVLHAVDRLVRQLLSLLESEFQELALAYCIAYCIAY